MNISTNPEIIDNVIQNDNFQLRIRDHPMKPFDIRYWDDPNYDYTEEEYLEHRSPRACSWIRDQEYLVDFKYYESLEFKDGSKTKYLHIFPKVRYELRYIPHSYVFLEILRLKMRHGQTESADQGIPPILLSMQIAIKVFVNAILDMLLLRKKIFVIIVHRQ